MTALSNKLSRVRFRISTQMYIGIGGAVALTVAASLVGWFSFDRVADAQNDVNENSIPEMAAAFEVAEYSSALVAAAPSLTSAISRKDLETTYDSISDANKSLEFQLEILGQTHIEDKRVDNIRTQSQTLISNIETIRSQRTELFRLTSDREALSNELAGLRSQLDDTVVPAIDDQLFYIMTGYRELGEPAAGFEQHFSEDEFNRYRHLSELQADANIATELLANAFTLSEAAALEPLRERFEAVDSRIQRNLRAIEDSDAYADIAPAFARLSEMGMGEDNGFALLERELSINESQILLLAKNQEEAVALVSEVDSLVVEASASANAAAAVSTQAIFNGRTLLLGISATSVGGAFLIAWLFVGRYLIHRIQLLSDWMRRMAAGDLEAQVAIAGNDEVTDMAAALEVFRQHALEVQRLNLVETLAADLQERNDELQRVLEELRLAQDQIITRQKLAEMGELTAGVAHEIRNPLNFVKNFAEASEELMEELKEVLDEEGVELPDEQRDLIEDISQDLTDNLERIRSHGDRANRIVHDMLMLGRGSGEAQPVSINSLLNEYALLAYHSARAMDPDFQLDLQVDFDPDAGEWSVAPEEMGRVFLNMVSNACYATDEKRRSLAENGGMGGYMPTLWLKTQRTEDAMEIIVRDNGNGIPADVIEKIFNPFFTTKPANKGTGLGLAMSNDIVREHGGTISPVSVPGEYTEMKVVLPVDGIKEKTEES